MAARQAATVAQSPAALRYSLGTCLNAMQSTRGWIAAVGEDTIDKTVLRHTGSSTTGLVICSGKHQQLEVNTRAEQRDIWGRQQPATQDDRSADDCGVATPDAALEELRLYSSWDRCCYMTIISAGLWAAFML